MAMFPTQHLKMLPFHKCWKVIILMKEQTIVCTHFTYSEIRVSVYIGGRCTVTSHFVQITFLPFLSGTKAAGLTGREAADHFPDRRGTVGGDHHGENEAEAFESHPD